MKLEHTALNVSDATGIAKWYVENMGMKIVSAMTESPFTHFLADDNGMMIEIYSNDAADIPDYKTVHHLVLHIAFVSEDPDRDRKRLEDTGASFIEEVRLPDGTLLIMMRDPWGLAIQLCKRVKH